MNILTIDFETYYSRDFSLTKMTTEEYVRSPHFEVIGVAVKVDDEDTKWFSGTYAETKEFLQKFNWRESLAVAHNAMFDAAILTWYFGIKPRGWIDTLSMARAIHGTEVGGSLATLARHYQLGAKGTEVTNALGKRRLDFTLEELRNYGDYCVNDVDLTYDLLQCLLKDFPQIEMRLIDLTIKMYSEPVLVLDKTALTEHLAAVQKKKEDLLAKVTVDKATLMSNPQFADVLTSLGVTPPMKISPTTGRETLALAKNDEEFKALAEHPNPDVQALVAARLGTKSTLEETRTERFISIAERGKMPVPLKYYAAHTGRWGGTDNLNLQNLPRSSPLKHAIRAPQGYVMIDSDSSQIEARTLAWLAGQWDLVQAFERGEDVYRIMASAIYNKPVEDITKDERFVGKTTILGSGYGMGAKKFQAQLKTFGVTIAEEEAQRIISVYRETYPRIPLLWKDCQKALVAILIGQRAGLPEDKPQIYAEGENGIRLPNGLYLKYPNLRIHVTPEGKEEFVYDTKKGKAVIPNRIYGGKVTENCIAGGTLVLTNNGWKPIEDISSKDKVHDGVDFVSHGGVVFKSVQTCIQIDGVWMTPDHEVLTNDGWKTASQNPQPYRPNLWGVNRYKPRTQQWQEKVLAISMSMWNALCKSWGRRTQRNKTRGYTQLWVFNKTTYSESKYYSWDEQTPGVCRMAFNGGPLLFTNPSSVGKLWGQGYFSMRGVATKLSSLLGRYGVNVPARFRFGSYRQQWRVYPSELPMDYAPHQFNEQTQYRTTDRCGGTKQKYRGINKHYLLPSSAQLASEQANFTAVAEKQVYDIINCGPRHRFVVLGNEAPFIVHNCCQALARIIIGEQMLLIAKRYRVVMTVHDAIACIAPKEEAEVAKAFVEQCMKMRPDWCEELPLNCEAGYGETYGSC